jgi:hypothetical protein
MGRLRELVLNGNKYSLMPTLPYRLCPLSLPRKGGKGESEVADAKCPHYRLQNAICQYPEKALLNNFLNY